MEQKKKALPPQRDYYKMMKNMGINPSSHPTYKNAEDHARNFRKISIQKHTQVAFTTTVATV